jgi:hypothetical protein
MRDMSDGQRKLRSLLAAGHTKTATARREGRGFGHPFQNRARREILTISREYVVMTTATTVMLRLDQIDRDPNSLQMRSNIANLDPVVDHYATLMEDGVEFPPLTIIQEGEKFWCADGNLRWLAVSKNAIERNGPKEILCQVSQGRIATQSYSR